MRSIFRFTFESLKKQFEEALQYGYRIITCYDYGQLKKDNKIDSKILVNRVDIDKSCRKAKRLAMMFNALDIKATFFVRLHADEYNPFSFENYRCLKYIRDSGHEIGYHSEVIDESVIWSENAERCLNRDILVLNQMLDIKVAGVASHGGFTGLNNLDFWKDKSPSALGLLYEAYDRQPAFDLFYKSFYVTDSSWTYWKCYDNGVLREGDYRTLGEHLNDNHHIVYSLIHPETFYDEHFYE